MTASEPSEAKASRRSAFPALVESWEPEFTNNPIDPTSFRWRLALPFVAVLVVVLLLLSLFLGLEARERYESQLSTDLEGRAMMLGYGISRELEAGGMAEDIQRLVDSIEDNRDSRYTVIGADGEVMADTDFDPANMDNHANRPEVIGALQDGRGDSKRGSSTADSDFLYVAVVVPGQDGVVVRAALPLDEVEATVRGVWLRSLAAGVVACVLIIGVAWVIAGKIVSPLESLRQHAHAIAGGDLSVRIDAADVPEITEVGFAFNRMTSELQRSQIETDQARSRLEAVLAELADGVVITDESGGVLKMNPAAQTLLDANEASSIGRPFVQACRDHELAEILKTALAGNQHSEAAVEHGMNRRTLLTTAQVVRDSNERLGLVVMRDISELRRLETVRREFVANVSHELRTPLTSIRAMVETLEAGAIEERDLSMDFLGRIVHEVDRLTALVEDLLDLARLEAGRTKISYGWVEVPDLIHGTASRMEAQIARANLTLGIDAAGELQPIRIDRARVEQVLINLIHNAIKFTPVGGTITLRAYQDSGNTTLEVQDTGIGITQVEMNRLFERFYKSDKARRSDGTGLGLAIAKHIVQAHGGEIGVESTVGEGALFRIVLPNRKPKGNKPT
jgi:two-component system phosphate regulon sensor histidine kinase PhoR